MFRTRPTPGSCSVSAILYREQRRGGKLQYTGHHMALNPPEKRHIVCESNEHLVGGVGVIVSKGGRDVWPTHCVRFIEYELVVKAIHCTPYSYVIHVRKGV